MVVEYIDGEMFVTETKVVTNHYLTEGEKYGTGSEQSLQRFDTLSQYSGKTDEAGAMEILKSVAQFNYPQTEGSYEKTMWSIVYSPATLTADFCFGENYEQSYGLILLDKNGWLQ